MRSPLPILAVLALTLGSPALAGQDKQDADPGKPVKFSMRFAPELVTIKFEPLRDQYVQTPLKVADPRAWATSGTLVFDGTIENPR